MKVTRSRLKEIIKEELEGVLSEEPQTPDRFITHMKAQFRRPANQTSLDAFINAYNLILSKALESPLEDRFAAGKIADEIEGEVFDRTWAKFHLSLLQGLPIAALEQIPSSSEAEFIKAAKERIAGKEAKAALPPQEYSDEEKKAARIEFGRRMHAGEYGKLD
tara:strand:+ start:681 stop:1169 length:489 start_codon:yes stop_codon:yes gene_type:complete